MMVSKKIDEIDTKFWANLANLNQNQTDKQNYFNDVFYWLNSGKHYILVYREKYSFFL